MKDEVESAPLGGGEDLAAQLMGVGFVDSHTECEPTRVLLRDEDAQGLPSAEALAALVGTYESSPEQLAPWLGAVREPRGHGALVAARVWTRPPGDVAGAGDPAAAVIFFNDIGPLPMCIHGTIGVLATLRALHLAPLGAGCLLTPRGLVHYELGEDSSPVRVQGVPSRVEASEVVVGLADGSEVRGSIADGGNAFFLVEERWPEGPAEERVRVLHARTQAIRRAVDLAGLRTAAGRPVDHVGIHDPAAAGPGADEAAFVLCPGGAFDRSPCGTGTSARLAVLAAQGRLKEGQERVFESACGGRFRASWRSGESPGIIHPSVAGRAFLTARGTLLAEAEDPLVGGHRP